MDSIGSYSSSSAYSYAQRREEMFSKIDSDGDGQVSLEEFSAAKPADAPEDSSSKIFAEMDANGDGSVSEDEFASSAPPPPPGGAGMMNSEMLAALLESMDTDGDGNVSEDEFAAAKPEDAPEGSSEMLFAELDLDGSGTLSEEELASAPPPPPPPHGSGMKGEETVSASEESSDQNILEILQQEMENYLNSAYSQANNAYAAANDLSSLFATQQQARAAI